MDPALSKKLLLKDGTPLAVVGAPHDHAALYGVSTGVKVAAAVLVYAADSSELDARLRKVTPALAPDARLWIAYPKAKQLATDLNRDILCDLLGQRGFQSVRQVAIDDTWSALWFKPGAGGRRANKDKMARAKAKRQPRASAR